MSGLHSQSRRKGILRLADLGEFPAPPAQWQPPPLEECDQAEYVLPCDGGDFAADRIKLRMVTHRDMGHLVDFAVIQVSLSCGAWREVVVVDSCHGDVHLHRYSRRSDSRVGEREIMLRIADVRDIQEGYGLAYDRVFENWVHNKQRWADG